MPAKVSGAPAKPRTRSGGAGMNRRGRQRYQIHPAQRMKLITLASIALLVLAAFPIYLWVNSVSKDPVFAALDGLELPVWAAQNPDENFAGSRWCVSECRLRDRTWQSERAPDVTQKAYDRALREQGWRPRADGACPTADDSIISCWYRDEYVLDMVVRAPICEEAPVRPTTSASSGASASADADSAAALDACPGSLVTMKIYNAIDYRLNL